MNLKAHWRTMRQASWLGWQLEANWTSPWLFLAYSIMKPIAGTLILVVMYLVVLQGVGNNIALFSFMYVGNAFYVFVMLSHWVTHQPHLLLLQQVKKR